MRVNKLRLNVQKVEPILLHRKKTKLIIEYVKIKLTGKKTTPTRTVEYLGILLNHH